MVEGFFLGFANGTACVAHCAPVIVPYFLCDEGGGRKTHLGVAMFLTGRLLGYLAFGIMAWSFGAVLLAYPFITDRIFGCIFILLSVVLVTSSLAVPKKICTLQSLHGVLNPISTGKQKIVPVFLGVLTGLNFCPPFLLAISSTAAAQGSLTYTLLFFVLFYCGTLIYFLPFLFLGVRKRTHEVQTLGKMMSFLMASYFSFKGGIMIFGSFN